MVLGNANGKSFSFADIGTIIWTISNVSMFYFRFCAGVLCVTSVETAILGTIVHGTKVTLNVVHVPLKQRVRCAALITTRETL